MSSLTKETEELAKQMSSKDEKTALTCCLSQQPLTDSSTYFQMATVIPTNVAFRNAAAPHRHHEQSERIHLRTRHLRQRPRLDRSERAGEEHQAAGRIKDRFSSERM